MPVWCGCFTPTTQRVSAAATLLIPLLFRRWSLPCTALPAHAVADRLIAFPQLGRSELLLRASLLFSSVPSHTPLSRSFAVSAVSYAVRRFSDAEHHRSGLCLCIPQLFLSAHCFAQAVLSLAEASHCLAVPWLSLPMPSDAFPLPTPAVPLQRSASPSSSVVFQFAALP